MWRRRVLTALACLGVVAGLVAVVLVTDDDPVRVITLPPPATEPTTSAAVPSATSTTTTRPTSTTTTTSVRPTTTTNTTAPPAAGTGLRPGASGADVTALQQRLVALGYWVGPVDGVFGQSTTHAVVAFQKSVGLPPDGVAGPATLDRLAASGRPSARSTSGRVIEVDLDHQILLVVLDGTVEWVMDASTGKVAGTTPTGRFAVYDEVDGYDPGPLGVLYRPKYFIRGVAVHGYPSVPPSPASHGCVRVTNATMDWLWANGVMALGTPVWVY